MSVAPVMMSPQGDPKPAGEKSSAMRRPRKRGKYTRIACESCKMRKVKCSGTVPCGRCVELNAQCKYPGCPPGVASPAGRVERGRRTTPPDLEASQGSHSPARVDANNPHHGIGSCTALLLGRDAPLKRRRRSNQIDIVFTSDTQLTNFVQSLNLARAVLGERGVISSQELAHHHVGSPDGHPQPQETWPATLEAALPLLDMGQDAALGHLQACTEEIFPIYPCVDVNLVREKLTSLFRQALHPSGAFAPEPLVELIDVEIAKAVCALGMLIRDDVVSPLSCHLEAYLVWSMDRSMSGGGESQVEDVVMAALLAIYFILKSQDLKAYRMAGFATRTAVELGMHCERFHRDDSDDAPHPSSLPRALFLCVSDLDKRCSFVMNLPCNLNDKVVDGNVLDSLEGYPFLSAMIRLNSINAELFDLVNASPSESISNQTLRHGLQAAIEDVAKRELFPSTSSTHYSLANQTLLPVVRDMRVVGIRMLEHFSPLRSVESLLCEPQSTQALISWAMREVNLYAMAVNATEPTGINRLWRSLFNHFLMTSISCMFLAAACSPSTYGPLCRVAFHTAVDFLLKCPNHRSLVATKRCSSLHDLKKIAERLQMPALEGSQSAGVDDEGYLNAEMPGGVDDINWFSNNFQFPIHGSLGAGLLVNMFEME